MTDSYVISDGETFVNVPKAAYDIYSRTIDAMEAEIDRLQEIESAARQLMDPANKQAEPFVRLQRLLGIIYE